jgi:hypothetical protein
MIQNRTSNRRAHKQPHCHNPKALTQPRANLLASIGGKVDDDGRGERDERAGEEPIARHEHDDCGGGVRGSETIAEEGGDETAGDYDVEGAEFIGYLSYMR